MAKKSNKEYAEYETISNGDNSVTVGSLVPCRHEFKSYTGKESKAGRPKTFKTPQILWQTAVEYQKWCEDNPLWVTEWDSKSQTLINLPKKRAMSLMGFCIYAGVNTTYIQQFSLYLEKHPEGLYHREFANTIRMIRQCINNQKFEGAAANLFNATFMAKALRLSDRVDVTSAGKEMKSLTGGINGLTAEDLASLSDEELLVLKKLSGSLIKKVQNKEEQTTEIDAEIQDDEIQDIE